jgi:hypothetical protein
MYAKYLAAALVATTLASGASAQSVGVTVDIHQPGVYGRVVIGNVPPPVVYAEPVIIAPRPIAVQSRPVYLKVPPGHAKKWSKHCHRYGACNQPVYFVKTKEYEPRHPGHRHGRGRPH